MGVILLPSAGIVLVIGPSNSGKTTFLRNLMNQGVLKKSQVVSSDDFRYLVGDSEFIEWNHRHEDEENALLYEYQLISEKAFEMMDQLIMTRCQLGKLTLVDATHLDEVYRNNYIEMGKKYHVPVIALLLEVPEKTLLERDAIRENPRGKKRVKEQYQWFKKTLRYIENEDFFARYSIKLEEMGEWHVVVQRNVLEQDIGQGLDFIGDVHACYEELIELVEKLGYVLQEDGLYRHPEGRRMVSLGDVMSRGPRSMDSLLFFKKHVDAGIAYMVDSNHGWKIARWLDGRKVMLMHGDEKMEEEFMDYEKNHGKGVTIRLKNELRAFLMERPSHLIFLKNGVRVVVATHGGIKDHYIGKDSKRIQDFCRYGDTDGFDEDGRPIRKDWFNNHRSPELIVWGHDPKPEAVMINNTINIDQGVVFGGKLTAFRYPEKEIISVPAKDKYAAGRF